MVLKQQIKRSHNTISLVRIYALFANQLNYQVLHIANNVIVEAIWCQSNISNNQTFDNQTYAQELVSMSQEALPHVQCLKVLDIKCHQFLYICEMCQ